MGAVPVMMAVIDGQPRAGLEEDDLLKLTSQDGLMKLGSRDLSVAVAFRRTGGTTVSATCEMANAAGIAVFATGGVGGVHREAESTFDVSQDLWALARWPVAVVCAGAKSVLDLPRTMELLETLGVPVVGVGTEELPGFYTAHTGIRLEHRVDRPEEAAALIRARRDLGQGGVVFALPPPKGLGKAEIERHVKASLTLARKKRITGKALTPFLLAELARRSQGKTLEVNLALLEHNASFAAQLALALGWK
jgi:pseudouridine-5'-phosphate glycosidase